MKKLISGFIVSMFLVSGAMAYNFNQLPPNKVAMFVTTSVTSANAVWSVPIVSGEANLIQIKARIGDVRWLQYNNKSTTNYITLLSGETYSCPQYIDITKGSSLYFLDTRTSTGDTAAQLSIIYWYR
jgi:hypothetical protein